jgi:hypothetical protein
MDRWLNSEGPKYTNPWEMPSPSSPPRPREEKKKRGRPRKPEVSKAYKEEDEDVEVLLANESAVEAERTLQGEKKKRKNQSMLWTRLVDEHADLVGELVKYYRDHKHSDAKTIFGERVAKALQEPDVFPPRGTLNRWLRNADAGAALKTKQGGSTSVLSQELQNMLLDTIRSIREASLKVNWKVVRRHALALMQMRGVVLTKKNEKFPSAAWCRVSVCLLLFCQRFLISRLMFYRLFSI